jgi:hypothetical protein
MTKDPADNDEDVAMPRAEETMYIQDVDTAGHSAVDGESSASGPSEPFVVGVVPFDDASPPRIGRLLKLAAAVLAVAAVVAFFLPAYLDVAMHSDLASATSVVRPESPPQRGDLVQTVMLVDSRPSGATVEVAGQDRGPTPAVFDLGCTIGESVVARVSLAGYRTVKRTVPCGAGDPPGMRLKVKLVRATRD